MFKMKKEKENNLSSQVLDIETASKTLPQQALTNPSVPTPLILLGPKSNTVVCPFCCKSVRTAVRYTPTARTHIAGALCSMLCCCCCIPFCSDSAKNADHYCPQCEKYLGTYQK